jgi:hypothetical protein
MFATVKIRLLGVAIKEASFLVFPTFHHMPIDPDFPFRIISVYLR